MSRPRNAPGELGTINYVRLANGSLQGRARIRTDGGEVRRLSAIGPDEESIRAALVERAAFASTGFDPDLTGESTVAMACAVWLAEKRMYGQVQSSTIEAYENNVRLVVLPACGAVALKSMTVGRCDRIIQTVLAAHGHSAASRLRKMLSQVMGVAVRHGVIATNPIRDVQRLRGAEKRESFLTVEQLTLIRSLIRVWRSPSGVQYDLTKLEDGMDIMLGTSARVGELLALRRQDVDLRGEIPTVLIDGTLRQTRAEGLHRKNAPKYARQRRRIALPHFAVLAVARRLSLAGTGPDDYLFATSSGRPFSISNFERLLRGFVGAHSEVLRAAGINVEEFSSHIFRRTAATLVERSAGITLASRLLGHANESVTRASYVVTAEQVDPTSATILDRALGGSRHRE